MEKVAIPFIAILMGFMSAIVIRNTSNPQFWKINKWRTRGLFFGMIALAIQPSIWFFNAVVHRYDETMKENSHMWDMAYLNEAQACTKAGLKDPAWSNYRFTCIDDRGFVHEIRPPKCNREFLRINPPPDRGKVCSK